MKEHEISSPVELDNALRARALRRRSDLWKVASGRSFRWTEVIGGVLALLIAISGMVQYFDEGDGAVQVALGLALLASFVWTHMYRRLDALVDIVKRLEDERRAASRHDG